MYDRGGDRDWVVSPVSLIRRAVAMEMVTPEEAESDLFLGAALATAEDLRSSWPEGEGFGSSDFNFLLETFLRTAGVKTAFINNRLERI